MQDNKKEVNYEVEDNDDYLIHLEDILQRIHDFFYKTFDAAKTKGFEEAMKDPEVRRYYPPGACTPDTKIVVSELRKEVLRGANITFTGVIPTNIKPEDSQIWRDASALGAKVSDRVIRPKDSDSPNDVTTHVIAARLGTQKAYLAVKTPGIKLVNPGWLSCCAERWEWVDERLFPVEGADRYKEQISGLRTPRRSRGTPQPIAKERNLEESGEEGESKKSERQRSDSASSADLLMSTLNPLLTFSASEVQAMDKEVEELMNTSGEESETDILGSVSGLSSPTSSSASSTSSSLDTEQFVNTGNKRKRPDGKNDSSEDCEKKRRRDSESSDQSDDYTRSSAPSDDDDDDDMAALLEAELTRP